MSARLYGHASRRLTIDRNIFCEHRDESHFARGFGPGGTTQQPPDASCAIPLIGGWLGAAQPPGLESLRLNARAHACLIRLRAAGMQYAFACLWCVRVSACSRVQARGTSAYTSYP